MITIFDVINRHISKKYLDTLKIHIAIKMQKTIDIQLTKYLSIYTYFAKNT